LRLLAASSRSTLGKLVVVATAAGLVVSDLLWSQVTLPGSYAPGAWPGAACLVWALFAACMARRSSRASARVSGEHHVRRHALGRAALLAASTLVCPAVYLVELLAGKPV